MNSYSATTSRMPVTAGDPADIRGADGLGRRHQPRADLRSQVQLSAERLTWQGEIRDIGVGGAFISTERPPPVGCCVRLEFRLPGGCHLSLCAEVRWVREVGGMTGPSGFGVQFVGVGRAEKKVLADFVESSRTGSRPGRELSVHVEEKFAVDTDGGAIRVRMCGMLRGGESRELAEQVCKCVAENHTPTLLAYIDARNLSPCSDDSLEAVKVWMTALRHRAPFYGVALVKNAVAMLQLRRLAREVGVADCLVCFDEESEAALFWQDIQNEVVAV